MSLFAAIDHVQLAMPVGGEEQARAFYADALGLVEVPKPPALAARGGGWFESRPPAVALHLGAEADFRPARKAHPALRISDLDALADRLAAAGVEIRWDDELPGHRRFYADDPFGNRLEFLSPL